MSEPLATSQFDYELPQDLIAQTPVEPRDSSRLLIVDRADNRLSDRVFRDLPEFIRPGDVLVVNDTRVLAARLFGRRETGGQVEFLLLKRESDGSWEALARPLARLRVGEAVALLDVAGVASEFTVDILEKLAGACRVNVADAAIEVCGRIPLPPYIHHPADPQRYQTVYANEAGSAAAPTAGLHFTEDVLARCIAAGATLEKVTLHVGVDTFQPIQTENVGDHQIHSEWMHVDGGVIERLANAKREGRRVIAVGTTSMRTLESVAAEVLSGTPGDISRPTRLYITPGYAFRVVDVLLTNFHLPRTSLLVLVSAFAGAQRISTAYQHAIAERYRFYSFGDAMLIL